MDEQPLVLTVPQAAAALQVSVPAAYRMAADGRLLTVRLGLRLTRVPLDALRAQLAAPATVIPRTAAPSHEE